MNKRGGRAIRMKAAAPPVLRMELLKDACLELIDIASINPGRQCNRIERDKNIFEAGIKRVKDYMN